jgi:hypothetical protein
MITLAPQRRWFRFSLRTLFLIVTVFGCWLGYELNWIRQRHALLADSPKWGSYVWPKAPVPAAPGLLWMFGEKGHSYLGLTMPENRADRNLAEQERELKRAKELFPEADVGMNYRLD